MYSDSVMIFQLLIVYSIFLPFDRLTGVALETMGLPKLNLYKVLVMVFINVIGDILVLYYYQSLELVVIISFISVFAGIIAGYILVKRRIGINLKSILYAGLDSVSSIFSRNKMEAKL